MAKRKKKTSKINARIRHYFDNDPFDIGVARVETSKLIEMFVSLGIHEIENDKDTLLRTARMLWSEGDSEYRQDILTFFTNDGEVYTSLNPKQISLDSSDKLEGILETVDASDDERDALYSFFSEVRSKKITTTKIEAKLRHLRHEAKRERVQKALDGTFSVDDYLEFYASFEYKIYGEKFNKILTINTKSYGYDYLDITDESELIESIEIDKQRAIESRKTKIADFISNIAEPHTYLSKKEIVESLRSSPPKTKLKEPLLKESILNSLISIHLDIISMEILDNEILLNINETFASNGLHVAYKLELHVELNSLLKTIWSGEQIDFTHIHQKAKDEYEREFNDAIDELVSECSSEASLLHLGKNELYERVYEPLRELLQNSLVITPRIKKKVLRIFNFNISEELIKKQREALLARTIREFKNLFPQAREMRRKLTLHIGPTNSGKTYQAMQRLQDGDTGYYLAPLRLLALEGFETLKANGIDASLITGEEQLINEDATHISSTIEMLNFDVDVDVCVIDEVQMIDDEDRGWAWANAIIGSPAKEIIMTGSPNARDAIVALAEYLGEELEIVEFQRKNPLSLLERATPFDDIKDATAIIAFSRKEVLRLKERFAKKFAVSVVYGNLSPEVRREEARRFRENETQILIATDAIAMGMNLPIETILFSKAKKFDGIRERTLLPSEIHQISGRAGRYGLSSEGFVGALSGEVLNIVKKNFHRAAKEITIPFKVMANLEHIKLVGSILEQKSLYEILKFFVQNMEFSGPFRASSLEDMLEASKIIDKYELDIATKYHLSCAPLTLKSPYIVASFQSHIRSLVNKEKVRYNPPAIKGSFATTTDELLRAEDMVKEISLYLWLSFRFDEFFIDESRARQHRTVLNRYIEKSLQQVKFIQTCRLCSAPLPPAHSHKICQRCFKKNYRGNKRY